jgi:anthranilate phosphoribosyltransferase
MVGAGLADGLPDGLEVARESIDAGHAAAALDRLVQTSNAPAG